MNENLDRCCKRLQDELKAAESCLQHVGHHLTSAAETEMSAVHDRLKDAVTKCEAKRDHATQAGHRIKEFIETTKQEAIARFDDWKTDREISKIEKHADRAEQHATDAIIVAAFAILEAEVAVVEALKARKTAIEVAG